MTATEPALTFPLPEGPLSTPAPGYEELRARCPYHRVLTAAGDEAIMLLGFADAAAVLNDRRMSHDLTAPGAARMFKGRSFYDDPQALINMEGPEHLRLRRIVASAFTPRRIHTWEPTIREVAGQLLDSMRKAGPPRDLVVDYSFQLPVTIICRLLGVPEADAPRFRRWTEAFLTVSRMSLDERLVQVAQFFEYIKELIEAHRAAPGADLIDRLIEARDDEDRLSEDELAVMVITLIAAGNETTSNALGRCVLNLLTDDRVRWKQLRTDRELIPAAVDELLRYSPPSTSGMLRLATEEVELPTVTIRAGQTVLLTAAALRDPAAYPDPDTIRFDRDAPTQLIFGGGAHYCLGAHLAKAELRIGLETLLERLPELRLDVEPEEVRFSGGDLLTTLVSLPVSWN